MKTFDYLWSQFCIAALLLLLSTGRAQALIASQPELSAATNNGPAMGASIVQAILGLILVIAMIFGCAWAARRFGLQRPGSANLIQIVASASLGQRQRVVMVEIGEQWLVLGVTPQQISTLHTLPAGNRSALGAATAANNGNTAATAGLPPTFANALALRLRDVLNKKTAN